MYVISVLTEVAVDNHDNEIATDMKYKMLGKQMDYQHKPREKNIKIIRPIFGKPISHLLVEVKRLWGHILNYLQGTIFKNIAVIWYLWSLYVLVKTHAPRFRETQSLACCVHRDLKCTVITQHGREDKITGQMII